MVIVMRYKVRIFISPETRLATYYSSFEYDALTYKYVFRKNYKLHRSSGPALEYCDDYKSWYLDGHNIKSLP